MSSARARFTPCTKQEAELALDQGLVLPAYDYLLKCSQTFNVLDTRGASGVTERQALFARMRDLAHRVGRSLPGSSASAWNIPG